jgi:hypothetical protein
MYVRKCISYIYILWILEIHLQYTGSYAWYRLPHEHRFPANYITLSSYKCFRWCNYILVCWDDFVRSLIPFQYIGVPYILILHHAIYIHVWYTKQANNIMMCCGLLNNRPSGVVWIVFFMFPCEITNRPGPSKRVEQRCMFDEKYGWFYQDARLNNSVFFQYHGRHYGDQSVMWYVCVMDFVFTQPADDIISTNWKSILRSRDLVYP